jgi:uncharacterized membrane protein
MQPFWTLVLLFTIYSFIGWLSESIYCSVPARRFINRGFLNGPVCPVYGFGALLVITSLMRFRGNLFVLFAAAVVLTSVLEYSTALILEKTFHTKYWDYSDKPLNLRGRVCLENSLLFGGMSVVAVTVIHPALTALAGGLLPAARTVLALFFLAAFSLDTALSINAMHRLNGKLDELQSILDEVKARAHTATAETKEALQTSILDRLDETTKARLRMLYGSKTKLESGLGSVQRRLIRAFPHMKSLRSNESLQRVREIIQSGARLVSDAVPAAISRKNKKNGGRG